MDNKTIDLCIQYEALTDSDIKSMDIQELFDLRHEMLELLNKLGKLLNHK